MSDQRVNAIIHELPDGTGLGAYYEVYLEWLPRVGETIYLHSHTDANSGHEPQHYYEVIQVEHKLSDVPRGSNRTPTPQTVEIHVTPRTRPIE